jgi:exodeoxyribonuclease V gamma subunit
MLHLIQSNKMENLADQLVGVLTNSIQQGSVFDPEHVLVQSPGMSQWLKIYIAQRLGIAANIEFPLPSSFIWQLYRQHIDGLPEQSAFTKVNMTWKIMAILPSMLDTSEFAEIAEYLRDDTGIKCYQLASKIADVYDQYLVYRPEWILNWEQSEVPLPELAALDAEHSQPWQPILWRALTAYTARLNESIHHRANLHTALLASLTDSIHVQQSSHKPLMVFGISAMPKQQLEVLEALASNRDVYIFWFNPCQHYWGDIFDKKSLAKAELNQDENTELLELGNPLLASWGKLGRDYQDMLLSLPLEQGDFFVDSDPQCLLQSIQEDIHHLQYRGTDQHLEAHELLTNGQQFPKLTVSHSDTSLQIHACHSKIRELEVLHDQLLLRLEQNPDWSPSDIIVMMPDVAGYAPFIEGVFGAAEQGLRIPYAISDRNVSQVSPFINSFVCIMKLHQSRLTLSELLSLLEVPAILQKFDISLQEFELIQYWLTESGVRWGWDGQDKERWDLPHQGQNTWLFGLERLIAGYAMGGEQLFVGEHSCISPYEHIEGQQAVALGKCYLFIRVLGDALRFCQKSDSITNKIAGAMDILEALYAIDEQIQIEATSLRAAIDQLALHKAQFTGDILQDVFISEVEQNIQEKGVGQRFLAGYVNFCTLMPMRSIPFKMVCLLGMNDKDYPRQTIPMGFDLMRVTPAKRGDRSRRLDDRYLFLEAILSAREQLYFSYQGFSQRDNSVLSPSILLSELLEYCQQGYALQGQLALPPEQTEQHLIDLLVTEHKLHPYHPSYFSQDKKRVSFKLHYHSIAQSMQQQSTEIQSFIQVSQGISTDVDEPHQDTLQSLSIQELIGFFSNPAKSYFVNRWQSRFYPFGDEHLDTEPFAFDGLAQYQLNGEFVGIYLNSMKAQVDSTPEIRQVLTRLRAQGQLPIDSIGEWAAQPLLQKSQIIAKHIFALTGKDAEQSTELDLVINGFHLNGRIGQQYAASLVLWRPGRLRAVDRISLYLQWLALCATSSRYAQGKAVFINNKKPYVLLPITQQEAQNQLTNWLNLYKVGQDNVLSFYPEASYQWAVSQNTEKTLAAFTGNDFSKGDIDEPHIRRVCPDLAEQFEVFSHISDILLCPMLEREGKL